MTCEVVPNTTDREEDTPEPNLEPVSPRRYSCDSQTLDGVQSLENGVIVLVDVHPTGDNREVCVNIQPDFSARLRVSQTDKGPRLTATHLDHVPAEK